MELSEHSFQDEIIDFLPDATLVIDREGKVIAWNRAMEVLTGVPAGDKLGNGDYEYALPFYKERRPMLANLVFMPGAEIGKRYDLMDRGYPHHGHLHPGLPAWRNLPMGEGEPAL